MTALLGVLVLSSCMGDIAPGLQDAYCRAIDAWAPYRVEVRRVKWCEPGECAGMAGGMFSSDSRVIAIDPDWPFTGNELLLTIEHEYGHALGLQHRWGNSIMKPGWDPPFAAGPTEEDFRELQRMREVDAEDYVAELAARAEKMTANRSKRESLWLNLGELRSQVYSTLIELSFTRIPPRGPTFSLEFKRLPLAFGESQAIQLDG